MSVDAFVRIRAGEKRPVYGSATAASGTLTISGSPTCTLYDSSGTAVTGRSAIAATGYDSTALATVQVWYLLDTLLLPAGGAGALAAGFYVLVFSFSATSSADGLTRDYRSEVEIQVEAVP